jgi:hypothetical protein
VTYSLKAWVRLQLLAQQHLGIIQLVQKQGMDEYIYSLEKELVDIRGGGSVV